MIHEFNRFNMVTFPDDARAEFLTPYFLPGRLAIIEPNEGSVLKPWRMRTHAEGWDTTNLYDYRTYKTFEVAADAGVKHCTDLVSKKIRSVLCDEMKEYDIKHKGTPSSLEAG